MTSIPSGAPLWRLDTSLTDRLLREALDHIPFTGSDLAGLLQITRRDLDHYLADPRLMPTCTRRGVATVLRSWASQLPQNPTGIAIANLLEEMVIGDLRRESVGLLYELGDRGVTGEEARVVVERFMEEHAAGLGTVPAQESWVTLMGLDALLQLEGQEGPA